MFTQLVSFVKISRKMVKLVKNGHIQLVVVFWSEYGGA
jgi:hypothetical protein